MRSPQLMTATLLAVLLPGATPSMAQQGGTLSADRYKAIMESVLGRDSSIWQGKSYDRGSVQDISVLTKSRDGSKAVVTVHFTYNGGQVGWVEAEFAGGQPSCLRYWDLYDVCRAPNDAAALRAGHDQQIVEANADEAARAAAREQADRDQQQRASERAAAAAAAEWRAQAAAATEAGDIAKFRPLLESAVSQDSEGWQVNQYDRGSMGGISVVLRGDASSTSVVRGYYSFNGGSSGWVEATIEHGQVTCLKYWDFQNICRPPFDPVQAAAERKAKEAREKAAWDALSPEQKQQFLNEQAQRQRAADQARQERVQQCQQSNADTAHLAFGLGGGFGGGLGNLAGAGIIANGACE